MMTTVGIVGFGAHVPWYRLRRELIARQWGTPAASAEKAVATSRSPLELTFRHYHHGFGMRGYFWKARPAA